MNFSGTKCDECGRIKGESNHWHQLAVVRDNIKGPLSIILGEMVDFKLNHAHTLEIVDMCGEQCFYKHIGKLLRINPASVEVEG